MAKRSMISQLASVSEGALGKSLKAGIQVKERVERMVHAITELDDRVAALEQRVDALEKPKRAPARKPAAAKAASSTRGTKSAAGKSAGSS
jgi:hypothetical protein